MRLRNIPGAKDAIAESAYVIQNPQENAGKWHEIFQNGNPVHIEVGMGKGRFIMDMPGSCRLYLIGEKWTEYI